MHGDDLHFEHTFRDALLVANRADILSAFLKTSGVQLLLGDLRDALRRGTRIRVLTGDYLGITSADALRMLLRLAEEHPGFSPYFFETQGGASFHPKSYLFFSGDGVLAYVGSSNISRSALQEAVEWNLRLVSDDDATTFNSIAGRFEALLASPLTKLLTPALVDAYEARAPVPMAPSPEPREPAPQPNPIQVEALDALKHSRRAAHTKGLVVLATGLGKTYLAAFDCKARLVDLLPIVRDHVYHPAFHGSFSLKSVLPALVPGFGYDDLEIQDGATAAIALEAVLFGAAGADRERLRTDLLRYCERDTKAMVELHRRLESIVPSPREKSA